MRRSVLPLLRGFVLWGSLGFVIALPLSCAQGGSLGFTAATATTSTTSSSSGTGGTTTTTSSSGDFPTASSSAGTGGAGGAGGQGTQSGFPSATGTGGAPTTTSTGFPTSATTTTTATTSTTSSGSPSSSCDVGSPSATTCDTCGACAGNLPTCSNDELECEFDCTCSAILCCVEGGLTAAECVTIYGDSPIFDAFVSCLQCACVNTCSIPSGTCP